MSFGRKGLVQAPRLSPGQIVSLRKAPMPGAPVSPMAPPSGTMSPELAAFLAAERANQPATSPGLTEASTDFRPVPNNQKTAGHGIDVHPGDRMMVLAYVFWWFAGPLGAHRFYLRAYSTAWPMLGLFAVSMVTIFVVPAVSLLGIIALALWLIVDLFLIPGLTRQANGDTTHLAFT